MFYFHIKIFKGFCLFLFLIFNVWINTIGKGCPKYRQVKPSPRQVDLNS